MQSFMLTLLYLFRLCVLIVSTPVDQHRRLYGTEAAPYIRGEWIADCNLYAPSKAIWDAGLKKHFQDWLRKDFNEWRLHRNRESYPEWFRAHWAPGVIKADMACDGLGGCSVCMRGFVSHLKCRRSLLPFLYHHIYAIFLMTPSF
jgi:hypothetical protein